MKTRLYIATIAIIIHGIFSSCNEEWEDEQFVHYVSFKAPLDLKVGSTDIYVRYNPSGKVTYRLPVLVSGTTKNNNELFVSVGVDMDTLASVNKDHFNIREDLYYKVLSPDQYSFVDQVIIPQGEDIALMDIDFTLGDVDLKDKWVLPLTIKDDPHNIYVVNPRKNYKKAILRVLPFNDFSGVYSTSSMNVYFQGTDSDPMTSNTRSSYVVDENTIFFYAGVQDEDLQERGVYKILVHFNDDGTLQLEAQDPKINLRSNGTSTFEVSERIDDTLPYLLHRYVTLQLEYEFEDYTSVKGQVIAYSVRGSMTMERKINTQIPDEDQAIEW